MAKAKPPHVKEVGYYHFEDLDDKAKEKARQWWRDCEACEFGQRPEEFTEEFQRLAFILGVSFKTHEVTLMSGKKRQDPNIWWSLHTQGSGCCFEGTYCYENGSVKAMKSYAPQDKVLHQIAEDLAAVQKKHRYALEAHITHRGNYTYARSADIEVTDSRTEEPASDEAAKAIAEAIYDFMDWMYQYINDEWDCRMEDESVDENIRINEYEFDEDGRRI